MDFQYDNKEDERECVAYMTHMEGNPSEPILVIRNSEVGDANSLKAAFWMYYDGTTALYKWKPEIDTQKFYRGDTVTITF